MRSRNPLLCAAAVAALALAGCGDDKSSDEPAVQQPAPETPATSGPKPSVEFRTPKDGATAADKFTAKVKLANFQIDPDSIGKSPVAGKGHLHFAIDGGRYDVPENSGENGKLAAKLGVDGKYSPSILTNITYSKIPPGKHKLVCFLANNNHTPTGFQAETDFTVK